ncbi:ATP-binding protein [Pseudohalioglobus sediminis]|uniref:ATP-binding protein n=1 Tax=Pseudohalioglobus sediminis TaxID=2606449 RepID=A0A5B0WY49_9GAMM|nr:ATP-binding protein [Pseudohalioglobus sediminis]KAA1192004.1 ATP-binding protein [Pseudohalioglobus sediminis]
MLESVSAASSGEQPASGQETRVGLLVEVTGEYFTARLDPRQDAAAAEGASDANHMPAGQVGSYLKIRNGDGFVLVMVERSYHAADKQGRAVNMVHLTPLGELNSNGDFQRGVSSYPISGAHIYRVSRDSLATIFSRYGDTDFRVGRLASFDSIGVHLDASSFFGRHAAILGQSGAGKSWTVTSLIQSTLQAMPEAHIILLDMHGEYSDKEVDGIVSRSPFHAAGKVRSFKAEELEFPYWLLSFSELCDLLINAEDENASIQVSAMRTALIKLRTEVNQHLNLGHITVDSPLYYSLHDLNLALKEANRATTDFGKEKLATFGKFNQVLVRLGSLLNDNRYDFLMKPKRRTSSESLTGLMQDLVGLGTPKASVTVIDLSAVPYDVVPLVAAQIGRLTYEFNFWNPRCRDFPLFLICEEAHEYIPREDIPRFREARRTMERISKNGRKYGVGLCVVSQRPHDVSETVLAQCSSYICLRISNPDDQEYVRSMVPDAARGTFSALTSLSKGEAVALGEAVPMPVRFRVDLPDPPPNSTDIDYSGKWRTEGDGVDVEKLVHNWHTQER